MKPMTAKQKNNNEFYTPEYAITPILKHIPKNIKTIWCPCDTEKSQFVLVLKEHGYNVFFTHLEENQDFLTHNPDFEFDMILTNPPFEFKTEFLKKAYEYQKPFLFLLPLTTLEGVARQELFKQYGLTTILFDRRINFISGKSVQFNSSYFGLLPDHKDKIIYETIAKNSKVMEDIGVNKKQGVLLWLNYNKY